MTQSTVNSETITSIFLKKKGKYFKMADFISSFDQTVTEHHK